jgi:hypothetical protein
VECHGVEGVGQQLLVPARADPGFQPAEGAGAAYW